MSASSRILILAACLKSHTLAEDPWAWTDAGLAPCRNSAYPGAGRRAEGCRRPSCPVFFEWDLTLTQALRRDGKTQAVLFRLSRQVCAPHRASCTSKEYAGKARLSLMALALMIIWSNLCAYDVRVSGKPCLRKWPRCFNFGVKLLPGNAVAQNVYKRITSNMTEQNRE